MPSGHRPAKPARRSRSRHAGSITSYATGAGQRWKFQIYVPQDPERPELGDTRLTRGGFKSLEEAQRALAEALRKKKANARFQSKTPTIGAYADHWIAGLRLQNSTIEGYQKIVRNHITPYLGALRLDKLTATRIAAHYRRAGDLRPPRQARVRQAAVGQHRLQGPRPARGHARRRRRRRADPAQPRQEEAHRQPTPVEPGARSEARDRHLDRPAAARVPHLEPRRADDELFPLWRTLAYTGMRRSEALALRWSDINFTTGRISLRRAVDVDHCPTPPRSPRPAAPASSTSTPIPSRPQGLQGRRAERSRWTWHEPTPTCSVTTTASIRFPDAVTSRWTRRLDWASAKIDGLPRVTLKGLRHTHATLLLELGEHPKVVQERLGHSTITTTMNIYSHVTPTMQKSRRRPLRRTPRRHLQALSTYLGT